MRRLKDSGSLAIGLPPSTGIGHGAGTLTTLDLVLAEQATKERRKAEYENLAAIYRYFAREAALLLKARSDGPNSK
jgi:hypothetical protein